MSAPRDTKTRFAGVYARHGRGCPGGPACSCTPSYFGLVWDRASGSRRRTRRFLTASEARNARADLMEAVRRGKAAAPEASAGPRLRDARERFVEAAREGVALNKWGRPYRRKALIDLESSLKRLPEDFARRRLADVRRGDVQQLVDGLVGDGLSGSRIRSVVNALRSLYHWAEDRDLVEGDPAARLRLPAMNAKPRERVATPAEFAELLDALALPTPEERRKRVERTPVQGLADGLPWALAAYGTARLQEIRMLDWRHVDLKLGALELAADGEGRKPGGSWRTVPLVAPLRAMLRRAWIAQGRPHSGKVCPARRSSPTDLLSLDQLQKNVVKRWEALGLEPIRLHESRHTAATWLDHAGVSPKVASQLMGHKTPEYQPGAASITLERYTHTLPGELERARDRLDRFLAERLAEGRRGARAGG
jgi:integrase/recombinase XerC